MRPFSLLPAVLPLLATAALHAQGFVAVGPGSSTTFQLPGGTSVVVPTGNGNRMEPSGGYSYTASQGEIFRTPESQAQVDHMDEQRRETMARIYAHREALTSHPKYFGSAARDRLAQMRSYRNGNLITPQGTLPAGRPPTLELKPQASISVSAFPGSLSPDGSAPGEIAPPEPASPPEEAPPPAGMVSIGGRRR